MQRIEFPFVDPGTCPEDPLRPGVRLCPRCSKPGAVCCEIMPHTNTYDTQGNLEYSWRREAADFPNEDDYRKFDWRCAGGCNQEGEHDDRDRKRLNDQAFI